ncbi:replication endonuclease [Serratia proteamaculans]|uniref:replication endonuclease n=1 Tax=Serratia proteamaculans TaxID=28151 RepID=UPI0021776132|nr:replication endonuclease [Serratia proteamaculans]CAI1905885.1 Bacteriophage replication gene A protein (GPA) [Serratia proteamaculans]
MNPRLYQERNGDYHAATRWQREQFVPGAPDDISITERQLWHLDKTDHQWRSQYLGEMPDYLAGYFGRRYEQLFKKSKSGRRRANAFLRTTVGENILPRLQQVTQQYETRLHTAGVVPFPFNDDLARLPTLGRDELRNLAHRVADFLAASFTDYIDRQFTGQATDAKEMRARTSAAYRKLAGLCLEVGTEPPYWKKATTSGVRVAQMESGLLRMMAPDWWRARLKRRRDLMREHLAIAVGQVQKAASAYVSRSTLGEWVEQKKRNREFFKAFELENEDGDRVSLADMVNGSNANPAIRRCELMVRMRGFEDLAAEMGCVGEFYTITAPSKYHAVHSGGGFVSQWNGASPRQTQKYLCGVWAKARAAIARAGIHVFGFRVVEPHHDGTPHWHMLLFMLPQHVDQVRDILCYQARQEESEELQTAKALKARFHVEPIDPEKGSATGYIAKYISKNIDGYALDGEADGETGENMKDMAKAVSAWASRWRIRQFQQIGGAPVTVWRELRRLRGQQLENPQMDAVLAAADIAGDWAAYTQAQGGPLVSRADLVVRLAYEITERGNVYAEDVQRITGIYSPGLGDASAVCTRLVKWTIVPKLAESVAEAGLPGGTAAPWSSVNNCTPEDWRRLSRELQRRGFAGDQFEMDILARGSALRIYGDRVLKMRNGRLEEMGGNPSCELWPGWNG